MFLKAINYYRFPKFVNVNENKLRAQITQRILKNLEDDKYNLLSTGNSTINDIGYCTVFIQEKTLKKIFDAWANIFNKVMEIYIEEIDPLNLQEHCNHTHGFKSLDTILIKKFKEVIVDESTSIHGYESLTSSDYEDFKLALHDNIILLTKLFSVILSLRIELNINDDNLFINKRIVIAGTEYEECVIPEAFKMPSAHMEKSDTWLISTASVIANNLSLANSMLSKINLRYETEEKTIVTESLLEVANRLKSDIYEKFSYQKILINNKQFTLTMFEVANHLGKSLQTRTHLLQLITHLDKILRAYYESAAHIIYTTVHSFFRISIAENSNDLINFNNY